MQKSLEIANPISKTEVAYTFDSLGKVVSKDIICKKIFHLLITQQWMELLVELKIVERY